MGEISNRLTAIPFTKKVVELASVKSKKIPDYNLEPEFRSRRSIGTKACDDDTVFHTVVDGVLIQYYYSSKRFFMQEEIDGIRLSPGAPHSMETAFGRLIKKIDTSHERSNARAAEITWAELERIRAEYRNPDLDILQMIDKEGRFTSEYAVFSPFTKPKLN